MKSQLKTHPCGKSNHAVSHGIIVRMEMVGCLCHGLGFSLCCRKVKHKEDNTHHHAI